MDDPREELLRTLRAREGLVRLGHLPITEALESVHRSLPRVQDAIRLFDRVEERLGDRGVRDYWANARERCLNLRDPEHPGWFLPQRLLYLELDLPKPPPRSREPIALPDWLVELVPEPVEPAEPDQTLPLAGPGGRSGRLRIEEGPAHLELVYDERGVFLNSVVSAGDGWFFAHHPETEPFHLDPLAHPPQVPPPSLLTRDDLRPDGHPIEVLVEHVLALRPAAAHAGRVFVPVDQPGNVTGGWARGLVNLRIAAWDGRVPDLDGWVVVDAWNGSAIAAGPSLDAAFAAWREVVARVQPLPPVDPPSDEPDEDLGPEPEPARFDEETRSAVFGFRIRFEILPPIVMAWPEPRAEHVPAIAVPITRAPEVPQALADVGFGRVVRLFGEHGGSAFGFLRDEAGGFLLIGDDAVAAVDLATLDAELDRVDAERQDELEEMFALIGHNPLRDAPPRAVSVRQYTVWDPDTGRTPELRDGGMAQQDELGVRGWDLAMRHRIVRVRFRTA